MNAAIVDLRGRYILPGILYAVSLGFLSGVLCASLVGASAVAVLILSISSFASVLLVALFHVPRIVLLVGLFLMANALGVTRVFLVEDPSQVFVPYDGKTSVVVGRVASDPQKSASGVSFQMKTETFGDDELEGLLVVQLPIGPSVAYGDEVSLRGTVALPQAFITKTGTTFDYPTYLKSKGIGAGIRAQMATVIVPARFTLLGTLYKIKHEFMQTLENTVPEPESSFLEGMLLGNKDALSGALHDAFVTAGLVHVVVLSGYNLTLVSDVFLKLTSLILPRLLALSASGASVVLFALMAGLDATVVRAATMALIVLVAKALHRPSVIMRSLTAACVLMVAWHPLVMIADPSFVLSFLATFGLITLSGPVAKLISFVPQKFSMREIAASTLAVQVFVSPVLIYYTGTFSIISLPANLLALPLVPYAMLSGFIAACVGFLGFTIALPFSSVAWLLLGSIINIAVYAAKVPFASLDVSFLQTPYLLWAYAIAAPAAVLIVLQHEKSEAKSKKTKPASV